MIAWIVSCIVTATQVWMHQFSTDFFVVNSLHTILPDLTELGSWRKIRTITSRNRNSWVNRKCDLTLKLKLKLIILSLFTWYRDKGANTKVLNRRVVIRDVWIGKRLFVVLNWKKGKEKGLWNEVIFTVNHFNHLHQAWHYWPMSAIAVTSHLSMWRHYASQTLFWDSR